MKKNMKNPLLAGFFNMLVPGSVHIYIKKEWKSFILTFITEVAALGIVIWIGIQIQNVSSFNIAQGICPGIFALIVLAIFFRQGFKNATEHNTKLDNQEHYQDPKYHSSQDEKMEKIQKMRDDGLISEQQYGTRKNRISQKHNREE